jgi:hypothetical protein
MLTFSSAPQERVETFELKVGVTKLNERTENVYENKGQ